MLKGKSAIITGSTSGLGRGIATALASEGCKVVLNGFGTAAEIEELQSELRYKFGAEVFHHAADMTRPSEIADLMTQACNRFGGVDILVNNAGAQFVAPIEEFPPEKWDELIALNLSAAFHTTRAALTPMRRKGWGRIIYIASAHGLVASAFKSAYVAAKHGLVGLTKVTALETAREEITCNGICPGYIRTAVVEGQIQQHSRVLGIPVDRVIDDVILAKQPNRKFIQVEQVAALTLFLCSDAAATITGAAIPIDGGWTAI